MPTRKHELRPLFSEEEIAALVALRADLQAPHRRGTPDYLPLRVTLNQFVARLALERAEQMRRALAEG